MPRSRDYDLRDIGAVRRLRDVCLDLRLHLAAHVGGIAANLQEPGRFLYDNLMLGVQTLEVGRQVGVEKIVAVASVCGYPKFGDVPFREDDIWDGYPEETSAPYGLAKKMLLVQAQSYRAQYGANFVVVFVANLYGPHDNFDVETSHVIPALIRRIDAAQQSGSDTAELWGDGTPTREFLYVEDAAEGVLAAAERYDGGLPINLGTGREISIHDLAMRIADRMGWPGRFLYNTKRLQRPTPSGARRQSRRGAARFARENLIG